MACSSLASVNIWLMAMASSAGSDPEGVRCLWAQFPFGVAAYAASGQLGADTPYIHPWRLEGIIPDAYGRLIGYPRRHIHVPLRDPHPKGTAAVFGGLIHLFRSQFRLNIIQP
jgi:hypothetical protein